MEKYLAKFSKNNFEGQFVSTHTRIADKEFNIYGGSFCIQNKDKEEFWEKYYKQVIENNEDSYLTEKQDENGVIAIDLDFRYNHDVATKQHNQDTIEEIICYLIEPLKEFYIFDGSTTFEIYVMEKPNVNQLKDGSLTKDGIHFIIGLNMSKSFREKYRNLVMKELENAQDSLNLPLINNWDGVVDEGILKATTNWNLYGSKKPAHEAYRLTKIYEIGYDSCDKSFTMPEKPFEMNFELFKKLSVQNVDRPVVEMKPIAETNTTSKKQYLDKASPSEATSGSKPICGDEKCKERELLQIIHLHEDDRRNRKLWMSVCSFIIITANLTEKDWFQFCENNKLNFDKEKEELYTHLTPINIEIYYIQSLAKRTNNIEYKKWLNKWDIYGIALNEVINPFYCSNKISHTLMNSLKYCKEEWYMLNQSNLWRKEKEPLSYITKELYKYLDCEKDKLNFKHTNALDEEKKALGDKLKEWLKLYNDVTKPAYTSQLKKYLQTALRDDNFSELLDVNIGKLAFKNGIMDLETKELSPSIEWYDYITETIPYNYVKTDYTFLKEKLLEICNNNDVHLDYYLSIIGHSFTGNAESEKSLYFMIDKTEDGKGNNGKTFFFDILTTIFPNYVYKSKSDLILEKGKNKVHKQLAMMKGKRLVWLEELPQDQQTNASLIKELADGKTTENEVMFGTEEIINILFKLFVLSNHIPKIDESEEAIYNRYKQFSFNSHFDTSGELSKSNPDSLEFIADMGLAAFIKEQKYNEVINIVVDYAHKYYANKNKLPKIPSQFVKDTNDTKVKNNLFQGWFMENCEKVKDGKLSKEDALKLSATPESKFDNVKKTMKNMGFVYNKDLSFGKSKYTAGKYSKGGWEGVRLVDTEENDIQMMM
jgi:phage/plasmid-associated DNA primase